MELPTHYYEEKRMAMPQNLKVLAQIMDRVEKLDEVDINYLIDRLREIQTSAQPIPKSLGG